MRRRCGGGRTTGDGEVESWDQIVGKLNEGIQSFSTWKEQQNIVYILFMNVIYS